MYFPLTGSEGASLASLECMPLAQSSGRRFLLSHPKFSREVEQILADVRFHESPEHSESGVRIRFAPSSFSGTSYGLALALADKLARLALTSPMSQRTLYATGQLLTDGQGMVTEVHDFAAKAALLEEVAERGSVFVYPQANYARADRRLRERLARLNTDHGIDGYGIEHVNELDVLFAEIGAQQEYQPGQPARIRSAESPSVALGAEVVTSVVNTYRFTERKRRWLIVTSTVLLILLVGSWCWQLNIQSSEESIIPNSPNPAPSDISNNDDKKLLALPAGPAIAVLPFDNMSLDSTEDYFSDGLTEDIITGLTQFTDLFVIARNSTFQYKGQSIDVRRIGKELGARYVVEGSVRTSGDRLRVSAQLIDTGSGAHLWAKTYDRHLTTVDLFDLQDDIREHIVAEIAGGYGAITRSIVAGTRSQKPVNLDVYNCVLRARDYYRVFSPDVHLRARNCLETFVQPESGYPEGLAWLGLMYLDEWRFSFNKRPETDNPLELAFHHARHAVALDANSQDAQHALAKIHFFRHELELFFTHAERALQLNPNNVFTLSDMGFFIAFAGQWERGVPLVRKAAKLDPRHPGWYHFVFFYDHYRKREYEQALAEAQRINTPGLFYNFATLTAVYGQLGRKKEAGKTLADLLRMYPDYPANARKEWRKYNFTEELIEHLVEGLRKAGLNIPAETG